MIKTKNAKKSLGQKGAVAAGVGHFEQSLLLIFRESSRTVRTLEDPGILRTVAKWTERLCGVLKSGRKILLCGNGGSAAEAQHIAAEFIGRFNRERAALPAIALTTDTSILTSVANDYSYHKVFSRQIEALGQEGDALIVLSTSGNSENCLEAVRQARKRGVLTFGLLGKTGGALCKEVEEALVIPSSLTSHIQEAHLVILHAISDLLEVQFSDSSS